MVLFGTLGTFALVIVVLGTVAGVAALATLCGVVLAGRRDRLRRRESLRTYYGRLALTH